MNARAGIVPVRVVVQVQAEAGPDTGTGAGEKSWVKTFPGGIDAPAFREWFAPAFADWLRLNFRGGAPHVAAAFGCNVRTAENWLAGRNRATGDVVGLVFLTFPSAVAWFLAAWARERH